MSIYTQEITKILDNYEDGEGWNGNMLEDLVSLIESAIQEARKDERGITAEAIRSAIQRNPTTEWETGQYDDEGRCELEGYITIDMKPFNEIIANAGHDSDYMTVPLEEWERLDSLTNPDTSTEEQ